jgi:hypothetical protein
MKTVATNVRPWIAGTLVAMLGVMSARVLAPSLSGQIRIVAQVGGQLLALGGLFILCFGVRRRIQTASQRESVATDSSRPTS